MFDSQQLDRVVDQPTRLGLIDMRQVIATDDAELAADPGVRLARVGVDAVDDELLAVAEELKPVQLAAARNQRCGDLLEGPVGAEGIARLGASPKRVKSTPQPL